MWKTQNKGSCVLFTILSETESKDSMLLLTQQARPQDYKTRLVLLILNESSLFLQIRRTTIKA